MKNHTEKFTKIVSGIKSSAATVKNNVRSFAKRIDRKHAAIAEVIDNAAKITRVVTLYPHIDFSFS